MIVDSVSQIFTSFFNITLYHESSQRVAWVEKKSLRENLTFFKLRQKNFQIKKKKLVVFHYVKAYYIFNESSDFAISRDY